MKTSTSYQAKDHGQHAICNLTKNDNVQLSCKTLPDRLSKSVAPPRKLS